MSTSTRHRRLSHLGNGHAHPQNGHANGDSSTLTDSSSQNGVVFQSQLEKKVLGWKDWVDQKIREEYKLRKYAIGGVSSKSRKCKIQKEMRCIAENGWHTSNDSLFKGIGALWKHQKIITVEKVSRVSLFQLTDGLYSLPYYLPPSLFSSARQHVDSPQWNLWFQSSMHSNLHFRQSNFQRESPSSFRKANRQVSKISKASNEHKPKIPWSHFRRNARRFRRL